MAMHTITSGLAMRCGSYVRDSFSSALQAEISAARVRAVISVMVMLVRT